MENPKRILCVDYYGGCDYCPSNVMCPDSGKKREELLKLAIKKDKNDKQ